MTAALIAAFDMNAGGGRSRDVVALTRFSERVIVSSLRSSDGVSGADVVTDAYTEPVRDPAKLSNFWHPSDHRPILVDFELK